MSMKQCSPSGAAWHRPPRHQALLLAIENGHFELAAGLLDAGAIPTPGRRASRPCTRSSGFASRYAATAIRPRAAPAIWKASISFACWSLTGRM